MVGVKDSARFERLLIVGYGRQGGRHLDVARRLGIAQEITTVDPRRRSIERFPGSELHFTDLNQALDSREYDAAVVASPTATHADIVQVLLRAGIPTLAEKPIAESSADISDIAHVAVETRTLLYVGYVERFNPAVQTVAALLVSGVLGAPLSFELRRFGIPMRNIPDFDVIHDLSVHDIDIALLLAGNLEVVGAAGSVDPKNGQIHTAKLLFRSRGAIVGIEVSRIAPQRERELFILTENASLRANLLEPQVNICLRNAMPKLTKALSAFGSVSSDGRTVIIEPYPREPLAEELMAFARSLNGVPDPALATLESAIVVSGLARDAVDIIKDAQVRTQRSEIARRPTSPSTGRDDIIRFNPVRVEDTAVTAVSSVLASGVVARGPQLAALEARFSQITRADHAVAVANGTIALWLAGMVTGLGVEDVVLASAFSFAATANAFLALGCRVVPIDITTDTFNIDGSTLAEALANYPDARALVVVDIFGNTAGTDAAIRVARDHDLVIIEDAAQAVGAHDASGAPIGTRADVTTFSLYATKTIFAGEGGVFVSPDETIANRVRRLINHESIELNARTIYGLNQHMGELGAALALSQLPSLSSRIKLRRYRAHRLAVACSKAWPDVVSVPSEALDLRDEERPTHVFHQFTVVASSAAMRERLQESLSQRGIETRRFYPYALTALRGVEQVSARTAEDVATRCFSLPIADSLTDAEFERVVAAVTTASDS